MVLLEELASLGIVVTSAPLDLQDLVRLAPLATKGKQAFLEAPGPQACQVRKAKQEGPSPYLAPLEQTGSRDPLDSQDPKATEASLAPRDGQAFLERRALWASLGSDFPGLRAPKVWTAYPETWGLLEVQAARDLMAYLAAQVCRARRESLESVFRGSKGCPVFLAFPALLERRAALGDQASLESMEQSAPRGFRASEVTLDLLEHRVLQAHRGLRDSVPLEPWAPPADGAYRGHQVLLG